MTGSDKGMEMVEVILNLKNNPGGWFRIFTPFFLLISFEVLLPKK